MVTKNSIDYFNTFSKYYRDYSEKKQLYLNKVDEIIINRIIELKAETLLDIGSGDGVRAINIAQNAGIKKLILVDPSIEMIKLCREVKIPEWFEVKFYHTTGVELKIEDQVEVITCLWNVLGHISCGFDRIETLKKIGCFLTNKGSIFIDVNNRYNIRCYGLFLGGRHILRDIFSPNDDNGDVTFQHELNGKSIQGFGHLFSPKEIYSIISNSGLTIVNRIIVDYKTGQSRHSIFSGQLFFELNK